MGKLVLRLVEATSILILIIAALSFPALAQSPSDARSESDNKLTWGVESDFSSAYVWRGTVVSDQPVVQPAAWVSISGFTFTASGTLALGDTSEGTRPRITDLGVTYEQDFKKFRITPGIESFSYRDPLNGQSSTSVEASIRVSYPVGPLRLFTSHSVDVFDYRGAYFAKAGVSYGRKISKRSEVGLVLYGRWANATFNDAYIGVSRSAFNLVGIESSFTYHLTSSLYLRPHLEFSHIVDQRLRAASPLKPVTFGMAIGVEF